MQNRILLCITIFLSLILLFMGSSDTTLFHISKEEINNKSINVLDKNTNEIKKMDLEEYIIGVVAAEMPASFHLEALKSQAIASRTYAIFKMNNNKKDYDVVTDVSNQAYITNEEMKNKWGNDYEFYYNKIKEAVNFTKGKVIKYDGEVIEAYYFAMSNGFTEESSLVFSEDREYLQSVESIYDNDSLKNFEVEKIMSKEEFCKKLNISCTNIKISNIEYSNSKRVNKITINDNVFKGTDVRKLLNLRSTDFRIEIVANQVKITTKGYGHGVGMSQYGANGLAKEGWDCEEILKYYYKNVEIIPI